MSGECLRKRHAKVLEYGNGVLKSVGHERGASEVSSSRKGPMKEVVTSQKGKAVLLSPPTLAPVGFSHFCTHDQSFATG